MSLAAEKQALRLRMREARKALGEAEREAAADEIAERLAGALGGRRTVMLFMSFGSEVSTDPILERLAREGHELAVPHVAKGFVVPVGYRQGEPVVPAFRGIPEPSELRPVGLRNLDAVVVAGLAFDRNGYRLGQGGGFYDDLLRRVPVDRERIGIGFHCQVVREVPHGPRDERVGMVVTERETILCGRPAVRPDCRPVTSADI